MSNLIVPLDGSELAERALPLAIRIAELTGSGLRLVNAAITPGSVEVATALGMLFEAGHEYLDEQEAKLRESSVLPVSTRTAISSPAQLILDEAARPTATAVVMSTHGRSGLRRVVLGSVAEWVLRESPIPVYLVPASGPLPDEARIEHILVPLDGSAVAYSVLAPVHELAIEAGAKLTLLRVFAEDEQLARGPEQSMLDAINDQMIRLDDIAETYFAPIRARLRQDGLTVATEWTVGSAPQEILAAAGRLHADLIAMATHGRSGIDRLRYGSVAESVLRQARMPVMTFGPCALRRLASGVGPLAAEKVLPEAVLAREVPSDLHTL